jgi:hypothetical protein
MKEEIESRLGRKVDLIHAPVDENSLLRINEVVDIYGRTGGNLFASKTIIGLRESKLIG